MKIKHLFVAFGLLATLTACEEGDLVFEDISMDDVSSSAETVETVDINSPIEATSPEDMLAYTDMMREALDLNADVLESMMYLTEEYISNKSVAQDVDYISKFTSDINYLGEVRVILSQTNDVPIEFAESHENLITALDFEIGGARQILDGIVQSDSKKMEEGISLMNKSGELMEEYTLEIQEIIY